jgi:farnesyl-diphosphate farnesyltransferase
VSPKDDSRLYGEVLASVSRSFYLTIRVLPVALRRPIGLAYLLARLSDTIADSSVADAALRIKLLQDYRSAILEGTQLPDLTPLIPGVPDVSEQELIRRDADLLLLLDQTEEADRNDIRWVLDIIIRGQIQDVERFPDASTVRALQTAQELEDYTYSVAGCVGEFWTRVAYRHLPSYSDLSLQQLIPLGVQFGKGLQFVNILRDARADLANGRCYLPQDELRLDPSLSIRNPTIAKPVYSHWLGTAEQYLDSGYHYIRSIKPFLLRIACFLPWAIGIETLKLLECHHSFEITQKIKVSRRKVRLLLFLSPLVGCTNHILTRMRRKYVKTC